MKWRLLLFGAWVLGALACGDPVHDDAVNALGPEPPGPGPGPLHRPGQSCLVCHGGSGPASAHFSVAGTVFALKGKTCGLGGADVEITDANMVPRTVVTNPAGNFWITTDDWIPAAPFHVGQLRDAGAPTDASVPVTYEKSVTYTSSMGVSSANMNSHVGRDGSCNDCHHDPPGPTTPGAVYLFVLPSDLPPEVTCP